MSSWQMQQKHFFKKNKKRRHKTEDKAAETKQKEYDIGSLGWVLQKKVKVRDRESIERKCPQTKRKKKKNGKKGRRARVG